jgi:hypothetical protein
MLVTTMLDIESPSMRAMSRSFFASFGEVGKLLGHSSVRTTEMYAHLLDSTLGDLAAETDKAWSESLLKSSKKSGVPVVTPLSRPNGASANSSMIS